MIYEENRAISEWIAKEHLKIFNNNSTKIFFFYLICSIIGIKSLKDSESKASQRFEWINPLLRTHVRLHRKIGWSHGLLYLHKTAKREDKKLWCDTSHLEVEKQASSHHREGGCPKSARQGRGTDFFSCTPLLSLFLTLAHNLIIMHW